MKFLRPVSMAFPVSNPFGHWEPYSHYCISESTGLWTHGQVDGKGQHKGTDFAVPIRTPISAVCDGLIVVCGFENPNDAKQGFGLRVRQQIVLDGKPMTVVYGHMSQIAVRAGQQIIRGDAIGLSGNTGYTTGPHLHCELVDGNGQYHEMIFDDPIADQAEAPPAPAVQTTLLPSEDPPKTS